MDTLMVSEVGDARDVGKGDTGPIKSLTSPSHLVTADYEMVDASGDPITPTTTGTSVSAKQEAITPPTDANITPRTSLTPNNTTPRDHTTTVEPASSNNGYDEYRDKTIIIDGETEVDELLLASRFAMIDTCILAQLNQDAVGHKPP
eukprot:GHVN01031368.1.p1 GENE.GHVN01031368.1~~GHVN01031368.1.p1  ORF type:complete len:147 (-),score=53.03 GHVN01031368.1:569-1009(-)